MVAIKRGADSALSSAPSAKRKRIVHHKLCHKQPGAILTTLLPHSQETVKDQLLKSIAVALSEAGFDAVKPSALEMFRGAVDSFMTNQLRHITASMNHTRRTRPNAQDFIRGLAAAGLTTGALEPDTTARIPAHITQGPLHPPNEVIEEEDVAKSQKFLSEQLGGAGEKRAKRWIPPHCPDFPSQHTYKDTAVMTSHEDNTRKIREQSTQEGMLAEQALRRLMVARQRGSRAMRERRRDASDNSQEIADAVFQDALNSMLAINNAKSRDVDVLDAFELAGSNSNDPKEDTMVATDIDFGAIVNYDKANWRKGAGDWVSAL